MFIIGGVILTITLGAFMAMIFTSGMKNGIAKVIIGVVIASAIGFGLIGLVKLEYNGDAKRWNNGICTTCGTAFDLFDIEHHRNSGDTYYYKCENGHLIKTTNYFEKQVLTNSVPCDIL